MHIPLRMCIACREHKPAAELIRLVVDRESERIVPGTKLGRDGRGAYVCRSAGCIRTAAKKRAAERHLKTAACDGLYEKLEEMI